MVKITENLSKCIELELIQTVLGLSQEDTDLLVNGLSPVILKSPSGDRSVVDLDDLKKHLVALKKITDSYSKVTKKAPKVTKKVPKATKKVPKEKKKVGKVGSNKKPEGALLGKQVLKMLGCDSKTLRNLVEEHGLPAIIHGPGYYIIPGELEKYLKENQELIQSLLPKKKEIPVSNKDNTQKDTSQDDEKKDEAGEKEPDPPPPPEEPSPDPTPIDDLNTENTETSEDDAISIPSSDPVPVDPLTTKTLTNEDNQESIKLPDGSVENIVPDGSEVGDKENAEIKRDVNPDNKLPDESKQSNSPNEDPIKDKKQDEPIQKKSLSRKNPPVNKEKACIPELENSQKIISMRKYREGYKLDDVSLAINGVGIRTIEKWIKEGILKATSGLGENYKVKYIEATGLENLLKENHIELKPIETGKSKTMHWPDLSMTPAQ